MRSRRCGRLAVGGGEWLQYENQMSINDNLPLNSASDNIFCHPRPMASSPPGTST